ncbi:2-aminomuconic 6-semialdehyde dehydrogenase [Rhodococcus erythropolis]|uniref:aldehyde dehydrogenase n=1 Tax=Rhodococcus erythropolis TaxID=1833 RepID=UPI000BB36104|nr:aldehyde dehydrogenase [Rhodococcus erythropolis]PBI86848.1 2-aminomuconic 6-semialdehyde dehydrogenase [Rhodococcus erythropolis]
MESFGHVIDGEEVSSHEGATFESIDPWERAPWASIALGSPADAERAVKSARRAFDEGPWPRLGHTERGRILHRLADLIEERGDELALADTTDMGKPIAETRGHDVPRSAQNFRFFADHARLTPAETFPMQSGHHAYTQYDPAGVVAAIAPWNFPLMMETWKVAPALAWGNTVVLKPAEQTPASATILARLALEAGVPPGVLNVVHGYGPNSVGQALTESPLVDRITFTGESNTGRAISRAAAQNLTPLSLELGGKGANIVFADADLNQAVEWSIKAIYTNSGQVCLAGSRLYVQESILDEFLARFTTAAAALRTGDPKDPDTQLGPLASHEHYEKVVGYLKIAQEDGGRLIACGDPEGWGVPPTVVVDAPQRARVTQEEIFGPVVVVIPFSDEKEAVDLANDTPYGLNAMLFTRDLSRAHRVSRALRVGTVWTNCFFVRDLRAPFGGAKNSGVGREGGAYSREFFTEPKAIVMEIAEN